MQADEPPLFAGRPVRKRRYRTLLACISLAGLATARILQLSRRFTESPYLGSASIAIIVASLVAAIWVGRKERRGWILGGAIVAGSIVGLAVPTAAGIALWT